MLGSLTKIIKVISRGSVINSLKKHLNKKFNFDDNEKAFEAGYDFL